MPWPAPRSNIDILRILVIGAGLCWSVAFVMVALHHELQLYADGAIFSYAVAVQDVWAFHWHNISPRVSVFFLTLWPAELYVGLTGDPRDVALRDALYCTPRVSGWLRSALERKAS